MLSVDRPSTGCRPITDRYIGQVSTNYRPTIGEVLAKCRRNVGEVSVNEKLYRPRHIWNDYRPCLDRVSTHYRPTIDRYIDRLSTGCRPSIDRGSTEIDRLSTDCRPTIDRVSTAISTDISVDITHSKQTFVCPSPILLQYLLLPFCLIFDRWRCQIPPSRRLRLNSKQNFLFCSVYILLKLDILALVNCRNEQMLGSQIS